MNQYPLWRYLLILFVIGLGAIYALPNIYGNDPAFQVSALRADPVDEALRARISKALAEADVTPKQMELGENRLLIRFDDDASRARARAIVEQAAGDERYVVALNQAPAMPEWLRSIGGKPMYMGLDLRGGVHFLMQVDMDAVRVQTEDRFVSELRTALREEKIRYRSIARDPQGGVLVRFLNPEMKDRAGPILSSDFQDCGPKTSRIRK